MSLNIEASQAAPIKEIGFEAVIDLMHAEEEADMRPRESDLFLSPLGKRIPIPGYSMSNPADFEIVKLDEPFI